MFREYNSINVNIVVIMNIKKNKMPYKRRLTNISLA